MDTFTTINWVRTTGADGTKIHTGVRAGWAFVIRTPKTGLSELSGNHADGRSVRGTHPTPAAAKEAALMSLHPAEAMGWPAYKQSFEASEYRASWGALKFRAYCDGRGHWFFQTSGSAPVRVTGLQDARQRAAQVLIGIYGPVAPEQPTTPLESAVSDLESALRSAGIAFTPKQLAVAALALHRD